MTRIHLKPRGDFNYYFDSAKERLSIEGIKIVEVRYEHIDLNPLVIIIYKEKDWSRDNEYVKIFYETDAQLDQINSLLNQNTIQ